MAQGSYYVPATSKWPIIGSVGLFILVSGFAKWMNGSDLGPWMAAIGASVVIAMMFGWFTDVIRESEAGMYSNQVGGSFRQGMIWFIFSEVMFFAAFFGALFYARIFAVPWIGGEGTGVMTNELLYPGYLPVWPTNGPENLGGDFKTIGAFELPMINTLILLISGVTITAAHVALKKLKRNALIFWMAATVSLGALFLCLQMFEYVHAYQDLGLTLGSGIYGSTFFMLTGFHGLHVTVGSIMLIVITLRCVRGHFEPKNHFAFEATAWYWHFVDVVWLVLFVFVYVL